MKAYLTFILFITSLASFGQINNTQKLIDSLKYTAEMPYICGEDGSTACGDSIFWLVVKQKQEAISYLINSLNDTTETLASVPNFGGQYAVGDICFSALQEIIHGIPTFEIAEINFDSNGCGYCSFWNYIRNPKNRNEFKLKMIKWYDENKQNLVWVVSEKYAICDCSGKHPNGGHFELKK